MSPRKMSSCSLVSPWWMGSSVQKDGGWRLWRLGICRECSINPWWHCLKDMSLFVRGQKINVLELELGCMRGHPGLTVQSQGKERWDLRGEAVFSWRKEGIHRVGSTGGGAVRRLSGRACGCLRACSPQGPDPRWGRRMRGRSTEQVGRVGGRAVNFWVSQHWETCPVEHREPLSQPSPKWCHHWHPPALR